MINKKDIDSKLEHIFNSSVNIIDILKILIRRGSINKKKIYIEKRWKCIIVYFKNEEKYKISLY